MDNTHKHKKLLSLLSLCMRAGKIAVGETACEKALANGSALLVIIAGDASANTKSKFMNKAFYYKVPVQIYGSKEVLSKSIGKENRAVLVVTEIHFAARMKELLEGGEL